MWIAEIFGGPKSYSGHVPLGSSDLSRIAIEHRIGTGMLLLDPAKTKNVAVFEYELGGVIGTLATDNEGAKHAERVAKRLLPQGAVVTRIYTERAPCNRSAVNCANMIAKDFPGVPVTYSFDFAANRAGANDAATYMVELLKAQYRIK
jgi:nucleic acid/nucleotide deaminase of polymorphic system toxin